MAKKLLSDKGYERLAGLLSHLQWPLPPKVFHALLGVTVSVPIEFGVFDSEGRILMFYRKDHEYDGYHIPGTVLRDNEIVAEALLRLLQGEVAGGKTTAPVSLGWVEIQRGNGPGQDPTRHEISLLFSSNLEGQYNGNGEFFPVTNLPENTLSHHRVVVIPEIVARRKTRLQ